MFGQKTALRLEQERLDELEALVWEYLHLIRPLPKHQVYLSHPNSVLIRRISELRTAQDNANKRATLAELVRDVVREEFEKLIGGGATD